MAILGTPLWHSRWISGYVASVDWNTVATIVATGIVTFLGSWGVFVLQQRRRRKAFLKTLAVEAELDTIECMRIIPQWRDMMESVVLDSAVVTPFPFKKVVFETFRSDLQFLNKDTLQKVLIYYSRLDEAQHWIEVNQQFNPTGMSSTGAQVLLDTLGQAYVEGQELLKVLLPGSKAWGKGQIVRPEQLKLKKE